MSYAVKQDFIARVGEGKLAELTDLAGEGEPEAGRLAEAAEAASSLIDSYVSGRYAPPLAATPFVKKLCIDLALYELASDLLTSDEGRYKIFKDRYAAAVKFLTDVQARRADLPGQAAGAAPAGGTPPPFIWVGESGGC